MKGREKKTIASTRNMYNEKSKQVLRKVETFGRPELTLGNVRRRSATFGRECVEVARDGETLGRPELTFGRRSATFGRDFV